MPLITQPLLISLPLLLLISRSNAETRPLISPRGCYPDPFPPRSITFLQGRILIFFLLLVCDTMPPLVGFLLSFIIARSQTRAGHMKRTLSKWFVPFLLTRLIFSNFSRLKLKPNTNCGECRNVGIKIHIWHQGQKLGGGRKRSFGRQSMVWWRRMWNVGRRMTRRNPACGRLTLGTWLDFVFINTSDFLCIWLHVGSCGEPVLTWNRKQRLLTNIKQISR